MPPPEISDLFDPVIVWPFTGFDQYGQPTVGFPYETRGRLIDSESLITDAKGNNVRLDGQLILAVKVPVSSQVWQGELVDWLGTGSSSVQQDQQIYEVKTVNITPDLKRRYKRFTYGLMKKRSNQASL